jgi:hypothetical protein
MGMLLLMAAALAVLQGAHASHPVPPATRDVLDVAKRSVTLRTGIGSAHDSVGTTSKQAQAFYDQGLAYVHSYVWLEAARSFNQALRQTTPQLREPTSASAAHRARLSAALQRRLVPDTALQPTDLAERVGVDLPAMLDWIAGRREPSSSQLGRLIGALDPAFIVDVYGDDVEAMRDRFEDALIQAREAEARARAALEILRGGAR